MSKFSVIFSVIFAATLAYVPVCLGQTGAEASASSPSVLDTIVVTSGRNEERLRDVTSSVTVIDEETVKSSSATDVGQLLAQQGFEVAGFNAGGRALIIRGQGQEQSGTELTSPVLILFNGRRVITNEMDFTGMANVERVEIIRGPASLQYGPAAMGGVVNIITRRGTEDFKGYAEVGTGSFGLNKQKVSFSGMIGAFDFSLGFLRSEQDDYKTGAGWIWKYSSPGENTNFNTNFGFTLNENHRVGIDYYYLNISDSRCPPLSISYYNPKPLENGTYSTHDVSGSNIALIYDGKTSNNSLNWSASYATGRKRDNGVYSGGQLFDNIYDIDSISGILSYNGDLITATAGVDYIDYTVETSYAGGLPSQSGSSDLGGFASGKLHLLDDTLIFSAGGRYDRYEINANSAGNKATQTNFVPSVGVAYLPLSWLKLRANYAEGFRMPSPAQMVPSGNYLSSADLKPEKSKTYEFGIDAFYEFFSSSLTYFHTDVKDKIVSERTNIPNPTNPGYTWSKYVNIQGAEIAGFEFSISGDLGQAMNKDFTLRPYFTMNYLTKRKNKDYSASGSSVNFIGFDTLLNVSKTTYSFGVTFNEPNIHLTSNINARAARDRVSANWGDMGDKYPPTREDYVTYSNDLIVDFSLEKRIIDFNEKGHMNLRLEVNNMFDGYDEPYINYPMAGRNFYVGLAYEY
ncbi:MAG: TonB-dependent receptor [Deltaproteobacteria bacterium]|jgi:vitamin B12 transporter|nr:TonB-dependent receptor [Deltaproteobacteria bacterium]